MKKQVLSFVTIAALALGTTSCSNNANETAATDTAGTTTATTTTETTMANSSGNYAAMADTVEKNSTQGYYLNPKTGKPYGKMNVDRNTGRITTESGEPVWRYVDNRNWWVYGGNDWNKVGEARMQGNRLQYKGDNDQWQDYNTMYGKADEDSITNWKVSDNGNKVKMETSDGDKLKIKQDEEGNTKIKTEDKKVKYDANGKVIKKEGE